jgi:hypothetical protein
MKWKVREAKGKYVWADEKGLPKRPYYDVGWMMMTLRLDCGCAHKGLFTTASFVKSLRL